MKSESLMHYPGAKRKPSLKLQRLLRVLDPAKYLQLRKDFSNPFRALLASSGAFRQAFVLTLENRDRITVNRGDAPVWNEYFTQATCKVEFENGLFKLIPHDRSVPAYFIHGCHDCDTHMPVRWFKRKDRPRIISELEHAEERVYSQHGEDGVLKALVQRLPSGPKVVVEFGAYDGEWLSNSRYWIDEHNWSALLIEPNKRNFRKLSARYGNNDRVITQNTFVTPENINGLFKSAGVPDRFEILSIDIDSYDYYVWEALTDYQPWIVLIEYNSSFLPDQHYVVPQDMAVALSGTSKEGASLAALYELGKKKGYVLTYGELAGANLFFVHKTVAHRLDLCGIQRQDVYQPPQFGMLGGGAAPNGRGYPSPASS